MGTEESKPDPASFKGLSCAGSRRMNRRERGVSEETTDAKVCRDEARG